MNEIVQICEFPEVTQTRLEENFVCHKYWLADDKAGFLADHKNIKGMATSGFDGADAKLLAALLALDIVSCFGVGVDAVDLNYAKNNNIKVTNTPDVLTDCVADLAIALVLAAARKVVETDRYVRAGKWKGEIYPLGTSLRGKTLGVIGFGRIGQAVAARARAFGLKIAYQGPSRKANFDDPYFEDAADLADISDFLVVCCPGGSATLNLVNARVLESLGSRGFLINVARGSVVDEAALIDALRQDQIAGAALDVFAEEPKIPDALKQMDNVILQPHHGSGTLETRKAMGDLMIDNLIAYFHGHDLLTQVT
jgi:D-3-phosphoglycerate dehydrogenase